MGMKFGATSLRMHAQMVQVHTGHTKLAQVNKRLPGTPVLARGTTARATQLTEQLVRAVNKSYDSC